MISFSWDEKKNEANKKKHGVSFDEARRVFYDENAIRYFDPDHSGDEDRFLMVGMSQMLAKNTGMSYQNLINLYLRDCVETKKEPSIQWSHQA